MDYKEATSFDPLYDSMWKCRRNGKIKKASVANYVTHGIESTIELQKELKTGKYLPKQPHNFTLYYPKVRQCSSIHIRDRIVQRSLNDNIIYPKMTKSFIYDNMACQKNKGTTKAMDRLNAFLHRYYINNGNSNEGWVLQWDIKGYYPNMRHDKAKECFEKHLDKDTIENTQKWLKRQYPNDKGYQPGSQMIQILGISFLDKFDHVAKEQLRARFYARYMDDGYIISNNKQFLEWCLEELKKQLDKLDINFHPDKTKIYRLSEGITILGFTFKLTKTGKIIRLINPKNVKHERKKLYRLSQLIKKSKITKEKFEQCYESWKAHAKLGNSYKLLYKMDKYVESLRKEWNYENKEK